jgi:hypothetical protein
MAFIEGGSSMIREGNWPLKKVFGWFYLDRGLIEFIEWKFFHDKRKILIVYEMLHIDFIGNESWLNLLKGSSSTIREGTWHLRNAPVPFYLDRVLIEFIEEKFFHDRKRILIVYERLLVDFIWTKSWSHLLKLNSSTIREGSWSFIKAIWSILLEQGSQDMYWMGSFTIREWTWSFTRGSDRFYLDGVLIPFIELELFHDKRTNLIVY